MCSLLEKVHSPLSNACVSGPLYEADLEMEREARELLLLIAF